MCCCCCCCFNSFIKQFPKLLRFPLRNLNVCQHPGVQGERTCCKLGTQTPAKPAQRARIPPVPALGVPVDAPPPHSGAGLVPPRLRGTFPSLKKPEAPESPLPLTPLPVIVAEVRAQGVQVQGEPQSAAHQLCNHLSAAFPPARLPARGQRRQQNTEASIATFLRLLLPAALFPRFPTLPASSPFPPPRGPPPDPRALPPPPRLPAAPASSPGRGLTPRSPSPGARAPRPPAEAQGLVLLPRLQAPRPNPWQSGAP